jgi:hypothetical protein
VEYSVEVAVASIWLIMVVKSTSVVITELVSLARA